MMFDALQQWAQIGAEDYHKDPAPVPSLSASIAKILINRSPRHAWTAHPRLNPDQEPEEHNAALDFGSAAHTLLLGKGAGLAVIDAEDWRTKAAKEARDQAAAQGLTPILKRERDRAQAMVIAAHAQLCMIDDCKLAFHEGSAEQVIMWQETMMDGSNPVWCRGMLDWIEPRRDTGHIVVYDYKTTSATISPYTVNRTLFDMEYEVPAAMYERGLEKIVGDAAGRIVFRFVVQEKEPPYLLQVAELDAAGMTIGRKKVAYAIDLWRRCMTEGNWPGFPRHIIKADMPAWLENKWLEREMQEAAGDVDPFLMASPWMPHIVKPLTMGD